MITTEPVVQKDFRIEMSVPFFPRCFFTKVGIGNFDSYRTGNSNETGLQVPTLFFPLAPEGTVQNMNEVGFDRFPSEFIVGDGSLKRAFIYVDSRPNSPLSVLVQSWAKVFNSEYNQISDPIEFIRSNRNFIMRGTGTSHGNAELPWDLGINHKPEILRILLDNYKVIPAEPDSSTCALDINHTAVPLEHYETLGKGYCLQLAIFSKLLLDQIGYRSKICQGIVLENDGTDHPDYCGHAFLILPDKNEIFDPTQNARGPIEKISSERAKTLVPETGWFQFRANKDEPPKIRRETPFYPYFVLS